MNLKIIYRALTMLCLWAEVLYELHSTEDEYTNKI